MNAANYSTAYLKINNRYVCCNKQVSNLWRGLEKEDNSLNKSTTAILIFIVLMLSAKWWLWFVSVVNRLLLEQDPGLRTLHTAWLVDRKRKGFQL